MSTLDPTFAFAPTSQVIDPPDRPDQLAQGVIASLSRPRWGYRGRPWGLVKTIVLSILTFGLLPLVIWVWRFRNLMVAEQQQLWHLAEWLRLRTGRREATALRDRALQLEPNSFYVLGPAAFCLLLIPGLLPFLQHEHLGRHFMWDRHSMNPWNSSIFNSFAFNPYTNFLLDWMMFLFVAYSLHWLQVCRRCGQLKLFINHFNELSATEGISPVHVPAVGMGFSPLWTATGLIGAAYGAIWALPMVLAGVVHTRYVRVTSRQTRHALAQRVRTMLEQNRPAMNVPAQPCINEKCRGPLRQSAAYCPRCGTRVA